jgi:hypothetical protein
MSLPNASRHGPAAAFGLASLPSTTVVFVAISRFS